ncbi:hypothetical protein EI94DRAFT_1701487 [Lactarius quietus]|nr:hypothetical protein EI94DRAFT_1701487 [Lactarius quietus]
MVCGSAVSPMKKTMNPGIFCKDGTVRREVGVHEHRLRRKAGMGWAREEAMLRIDNGRVTPIRRLSVNKVPSYTAITPAVLAEDRSRVTFHKQRLQIWSPNTNGSSYNHGTSTELLLLLKMGNGG